ncbi:MAG: DUF3592 domain-containing protein [Candidatus Sericytochromatia bacterium]
MESFFSLLMALLIGGIALYSGISLVRTDRQVRGWPTVPGTIVDRQVVQSTVGAVSTPGRRYRAMVRYTYVVGGQAYEGDKILALGGFTGTREAMQKELDGFDSPVEVRYNPLNPADACLKTVPSWWVLGAFGGAALCVLVALVTLVSMRG